MIWKGVDLGDETNLGTELFKDVEEKFGVDDEGFCNLKEFKDENGNLKLPKNKDILMVCRATDDDVEILYAKLIGHHIERNLKERRYKEYTR